MNPQTIITNTAASLTFVLFWFRLTDYQYQLLEAQTDKVTNNSAFTGPDVSTLLPCHGSYQLHQL